MQSNYAHPSLVYRRADDIRQCINSMKRELADLLVDSIDDHGHFPAEQVGKFANKIAHAEGRLEVALLLVHIEEEFGKDGISKEDLGRRLLMEAVRDPQDKWSGRDNDVRRSFNDGRREAIDDAVLEYIR